MAWIDQVSLFLSVSVDRILAITAYGEAGAEGGEGMMAVINVVRNRTTNLGAFGDSSILAATNSPYHAVILKEKQFSMFNPGDPVRTIAERIASNWDSEVSSKESLRKAHELSIMLLQGILADNTGGADHYHATYVSPQWASIMPVTGQIGSHIFYASGKVLGTITEFFGERPLTGLLLVGIGLGALLMIMKRRRG